MKYNLFPHFSLPFLFSSCKHFYQYNQMVFKRPTINKLLFFLLCCAILPINGGVRHTALDMKYPTVSAAYGLCNSGDTLLLPSDSAAWTSTLTITKQICIIGQGTSKTKISFGSALPNGLLYISGVKSDNLMRISGIKFSAQNMTSAYGAAIESNNNTNLTSFRCDHCSFNYGDMAIDAGGFRGVIDHDTLINTQMGIQVFYGDSLADYFWKNLTTGTSDALFIEECQFNVNANVTQETIQGRVEGYDCGKIVVRFNIFDYTGYPYNNADCVPVHLHGNALGYYNQNGSHNRRGPSIVEVYNNHTFSTSPAKLWAFCVNRGGSWLIHDNSVTAQNIEQYIEMYEEETPDYTLFSPKRILWPAEDQVYNSFYWNDTLNGSLITDANVRLPSHYDSLFIKKNRDYWLLAPQPSGGYEYFNGRHGASSTFPTNIGTTTKVDSSVTDSTGTMIFSTSIANAYCPYEPYTHPHPLRKPPKPKNLAVY